VFAEVFTPGPAGYDSFQCQVSIDSGAFFDAGVSLLNTSLDASATEPGHQYDAQVRYVDSGSVLPPGLWSTAKTLIAV